MQILMPMEMSAMPMNARWFGICSPRHRAVNVVNRNVHDCVIGTASEISESCNACTYSRLPLWFNKNGTMYCHRNKIDLTSENTRNSLFLPLFGFLSVCRPLDPRLINGFVTPQSNPTAKNGQIWWNCIFFTMKGKKVILSQSSMSTHLSQFLSKHNCYTFASSRKWKWKLFAALEFLSSLR